MSLYDTINTLPPGKRLIYKSADGVTVEIEPHVEVPGRLDAIVRTYPVAPPETPNHNWEWIDPAWCDEQEQVLRNRGMDPDIYSVA